MPRFQADLDVDRLGQAIDDGQPEAQPLVLFARRVADLVELREDRRLVFRRDADAVVGHQDRALVGRVVEQADEQVYLNNNRNQNARQYDGDVIEPFNKILADSAPRKLIVIHLLGTHMSYQYRYPPTFDKFVDRTGVPAGLNDDQVPTYNSYDNAVLYNDFVVSSLIKQFSASKPNGFLLYLSDHGEAVFDSPTGNVLGRNEGKPTAPMIVMLCSWCLLRVTYITVMVRMMRSLMYKSRMMTVHQVLVKSNILV